MSISRHGVKLRTQNPRRDPVFNRVLEALEATETQGDAAALLGWSQQRISRYLGRKKRRAWWAKYKAARSKERTRERKWACWARKQHALAQEKAKRGIPLTSSDLMVLANPPRPRRPWGGSKRSSL